MKTTYLLFTALVMLLLLGCKKNKTSEPGPSSFSIVVENTQGQSLLNPATPGHFTVGDIKRTDMVNGNEVVFNEGHLDTPKGFSIINEGGKSFLLFTPIKQAQAEATTYFYWNSNTKDKVVCRFSGPSDRVTEILLNDVKVFPDKNVAGYPGQGAFKIVR